MATTKLYLDLRGKAKDGKGSVVIVIAHNRTTTTIGTGVRLLPMEWDGNRVINRCDSDFLNVDLSRMKNDIDTSIAMLRLEEKFKYMTAPQIKASLGKEKRRTTEHRLSEIFEDYLRQDLSEGTRGLYRATCKKILDYYGDINIETINYKWLVGFDRYLANSRGINGRSIDLRNLRAVCNYAIKTGLISEYAFRNFQIRSEPTKKRNIPIEKLREFYRYPCTPRQYMFRDYFFLMFYLIGINAADLFLAPKNSIVGGRFEYIRKKTHKRYSIKIELESMELLKKYEGRNYLVEAMDHCKDYHNFLHEMNDALKNIGPEFEYTIPDNNLFGEPRIVLKKMPIIPEITSYYARHTWATIAYDLEISIDTISQALGHSVGNRTTLIYVRQDQRKVDKANRRIIDYLFDGLR